MLVTGIYREPFMPDWVYDASVGRSPPGCSRSSGSALGTRTFRRAVIKLSQNDTGMTLTERKVLEAACIASRKTNAAILSHITSARRRSR